MEKAALGGLTFRWQRCHVLWVAVGQADVIELKPLDTVHGGEAEWSGVICFDLSPLPPTYRPIRTFPKQAGLL